MRRSTATSRQGLTFDCDLFVVHADSDEPFVHGFLLPGLGLPSGRVLLSSRFSPGQPRISELERGVQRSRVVVPVLTPAYQSEQWTHLGEHLAVFAHACGHLLVPLVLQECDIRLALKHLVCLDFRARPSWECEIARLREMLQRPEPPETPVPCPYPGMRPFTEADRAHFHGREREIAELVERLRCGEREIYVIGPSGSGKSSLVTAGVLPRLPAGTLARTLRPGHHPRTRLAETVGDSVTALLARNAPASRLLLFIDQLEELFSHADRAQGRGFIAALRELRSDERVALVLSLRADFYGAFMDSELWPEPPTSLCRIDIAPLRGEALRAAIERPARDVDVYFETRLTDRLLADAAAEPGVLPLLQDVLFQLWDARLHRYVPLAAYEALAENGHSGLAVTLGRRADATIRSFSKTGQTIARGIFLRLVAFGEGRPDTRRSRSRTELGFDGETARAVAATLDYLVDRRLLTTDRRERTNQVWYDIAHEALISAWPQLRHWIETGRADEERRRVLEAKTAEWKERRRGPLDEVELGEAEEWLKRQTEQGLGRPPALDSLLQVSRAAAAALKAEREETKRQRNEFQRIVVLDYQDQGRRLLLEGRPLRALPCLVAALEAGMSSTEPRLASAPLRLLFAQAVRNLVLSSVYHGGPVSMARFSPDGGRVVTASDDGSARIWDASSGKPLTSPLHHEDFVVAVAFSPDGSRVATASYDRTARLWNASSGRAIGPPLEHRGCLSAVAFSPDGRRLVTASQDRTARVWDMPSGKPVTRPLEHAASVVTAAFDPAGARIVTASHDHSARIWDAASGDPLTGALEHEGLVRCAMFSPNGTRLVTAGDDSTVRIWDTASGKLLLTVREHVGPVRAVAFNPAGTAVVTASEDGTARIWNAVSGDPLSPPLVHRHTVRTAAFNPDGTLVITASDDETVGIWEAVSGKAVTAPLEHQSSVRAAAFSPDGTRVLTACSDGAARVWDVSRDRRCVRPFPHRAFVRAAAMSRDGTRIVTASDDKTAIIWDVASGNDHRVLEHESAVLAAAFSPDGTLIVTASGDGTARIWNVASGRSLRRALVHQGSVRVALFSPDGSRVVTGSADKSARIWDAVSGHAVSDPLSHQDTVGAASFSPDGTRVVTASDDMTARIWNAASGRPVTPPLSHQGKVWAAAFSPDGARILTASEDRTARVWQASSGAPGHLLEHKDSVRTAAFSPDGARILTASEDRTARIWDAVSGKPAAPALEHRGAVLAAAFSPDGTLIVTASADRTARVWDAASGQPLMPPLEHQGAVVTAAFSPDGSCVVTASLDESARLWELPTHAGTLEEWSGLADLHSPFVLQHGILVPRPRPRAGLLVRP